MTAKIVVVGSFNADLTSYMERMPRPGETVHGDRFVTGAGGKGSNQAVAAARLGAEVTFIGRVGNDVFANLAYEIWDAEGVNRDYVGRDSEVATGVAPILVDSRGENMIVVVLGANQRLQESDIDAARAQIADADVLVAQLEVNLDMVPYALRTAKEFGVTTILNPAPAAVIAQETIQLADYLTPNETELETLSGGAQSDVETAARGLLTRADQTAVVTLGGQGAQIVTGGLKRAGTYIRGGCRRYDRRRRCLQRGAGSRAGGGTGTARCGSLRQCSGSALRHQAGHCAQYALPSRCGFAALGRTVDINERAIHRDAPTQIR